MAYDDKSDDRKSAMTGPARGSRWIWILGSIFLVLIVAILIRGLFYAGANADYERDAKGAITEVERDSLAGDNGVNTSNIQ